MRSTLRLSAFFIVAGLMFLIGPKPAQACHGWLCHRCAAKTSYGAPAGAGYGFPMTGGYGTNYGYPPAYPYPMTGSYAPNYGYSNPYYYRPRYRNEDNDGKSDDGGDSGSSGSAATMMLTRAIEEHDRLFRGEMDTKLRELDKKLENRLDMLVTSINEIKTSLSGAPQANPVRPTSPVSPAPTVPATPLEGRMEAIEKRLLELTSKLDTNQQTIADFIRAQSNTKIAPPKEGAPPTIPPTTGGAPTTPTSTPPAPGGTPASGS